MPGGAGVGFFMLGPIKAASADPGIIDGQLFADDALADPVYADDALTQPVKAKD